MGKIILIIYIIAAIASFIGKQQKKKRLKEAAQKNQNNPQANPKKQNPFGSFFQAVNPQEARIKARTNRNDPMAEPEPIRENYTSPKSPRNTPTEQKEKKPSFSANILEQLSAEFGFDFEDKEIEKFSNQDKEPEETSSSKPITNWNPEENRESPWESDNLESAGEKEPILKFKEAAPFSYDLADNNVIADGADKLKNPSQKKGRNQYARMFNNPNGIRKAIISKAILDKPLGW